MAMIYSSLNRLFLTTPPLALAGHPNGRSHISHGLIWREQIKLNVAPDLFGERTIPLIAVGDLRASAMKAQPAPLWLRGCYTGRLQKNHERAPQRPR
jgi:hypothetical protein